MRTEAILSRFDTPDEVREMVKGRFEVVRLGGLSIGRATYGEQRAMPVVTSAEAAAIMAAKG